MTLWDLKNQISIGTLGSDKYLGLEDLLEDLLELLGLED